MTGIRGLEWSPGVMQADFGLAQAVVAGSRTDVHCLVASFPHSNIEFSKWGTIFADDKLAASIIDRIVHHGRLIEFTGQSHRISQALMFGKPQNQ